MNSLSLNLNNMALSKTQRNKLSKLLRQACLARDGNKCIRCGNTDIKQISASHIYPKGAYPQMRWDVDNVKSLDYKCHIHFWHKHPLEAAAWLKTVLPPDRIKRLKKLSMPNSGPKKRYIYEDIKTELELAIRKYEGL